MRGTAGGYSPHIDGLRAVAVIAVVLFHAFPVLLPGGFVGVDVFFVISGFLISSILCREFALTTSAGLRVIAQFYSRRIRRIFPALLVVLSTCFALGYCLLLPSSFARLSLQIAASSGFFLNYVLSGNVGYFGGEVAANPLVHLWSLSVEEQFYLIWPLLIWASARSRVRILPVAVFFGALSYFWNLHRNTASAESAYYLLQTRAWELAVGAVLADLKPRLDGALEAIGFGPRRLMEWGLSFFAVIGLLLIGAGFRFIKGDPFYPDEWALLPTIGTGLVILAGKKAWVNGRLLSLPALVGVGLISYPLYLWHWPLLSFLHIAFPEYDTVLPRASLILVALGLAWIVYHSIEIPIRRQPRGWSRPLMLAAAMGSVACLGIISLEMKGLPSRFPKLIQEISDYQYPYSKSWKEGTCFLDPDQEATDFKDDPSDIKAGRPMMLVWGDSHAAALSPGIRKIYGTAFNIVQRTAAGVPPLLGHDIKGHGNSRSLNEKILEEVQREHPRIVVLDANWPDCPWQEIERTVKAVKDAGVSHVFVVGPVPQWTAGLPQQLCNIALRHPKRRIPDRLDTGYLLEPVRIDPLLRSLAERSGAEYLSPCSILHAEGGFLVRLGDSADSLTTFDYGHLTAKGATYVVSHFPKLD